MDSQHCIWSCREEGVDVQFSTGLPWHQGLGEIKCWWALMHTSFSVILMLGECEGASSCQALTWVEEVKCWFTLLCTTSSCLLVVRWEGRVGVSVLAGLGWQSPGEEGGGGRSALCIPCQYSFGRGLEYYLLPWSRGWKISSLLFPINTTSTFKLESRLLFWSGEGQSSCLLGFQHRPAGGPCLLRQGQRKVSSLSVCQFYHTGDSCSMLLLGWEGRVEY